jgi:hypothetical protein
MARAELRAGTPSAGTELPGQNAQAGPRAKRAWGASPALAPKKEKTNSEKEKEDFEK